eukprot:symbB.v1.2.021138.t1/scaffold1812.1/size105704/2
MRDIDFASLNDTSGVVSAWVHGAPQGEWHSHAWKVEASPDCVFPQKWEGRTVYKPCGALPLNSRKRVLAFFTGLFNLTLDVDTLLFNVSTVESFRSFRPSSLGSLCLGPRDIHDSDFLGGYPVRLVRQGRYLHHWLIVNASCADSTASIELRVWRTCIDVHMIGDEQHFSGNFQEQGISRGSGGVYAGLGLCCSGPRCHLRDAKIPSDCCPLGESLCGFGPTPSCASPFRMPDVIPRPLILDGVGTGLHLWGDGHAWHVPLRSPDQSFQVVLENPSSTAANARIIFHLDQPSKITGVATILRNASSGKPSGLHLQFSKNWHTNDCYWGRIRYDGTWFSAIVELTLPPLTRLQAELLVVYQFFGHLHSVSHAQLSLIGWPGSNGLWEEVGLGAEGESITYEPNMQQRRSMVLDTRPFLVCMMDTPECTCFKEVNSSGSFAEMRCVWNKALDSSCRGDVLTTGWTENHGGSDFLISNGPRFTNASYDGLTADGAVRVKREVSSWATRDIARHLHSFRYEVLRNMTYSRFGLYVLGADWYNFVADPDIVYGDLEGLIGMAMNHTASVERFEYSKVFRQIPCKLPCWFTMLTKTSQETHHAHRGLILRRFSAHVGGQVRGPTFSVMGSDNFGQPTLGLELGVAGDGNPLHLQVGDVISAEVELLLYPKSESVYYGQAPLHLKNDWELVFREAQLQVEVLEGQLQREYPLRLAVSTSSGQAEFKALVPANFSGVLPVTIAGVQGLQGCLWHIATCQHLGEGGDFQVDYIADEGYAYTYSLPDKEQMHFLFKSDCRLADIDTCHL